MSTEPRDPVEFIQRCIREGKLYWTYHVNMRLKGRFLTRRDILDAVDSYEVVESYPDDKYPPSYLVLAAPGFHVLFAVDVEGDHVRIVTAYRSSPDKWEADLRTRRIGQ